MQRISFFAVWLFAALWAVMGQAEGLGGVDVPRGLWETPATASGAVFHVRTQRCGRALCGRVERAKNLGGFDTPSNAVGQKLLWELQPQPDGSFLGEVRDAEARRLLNSRVTVKGRTLQLDACNGQTCTRQEWVRLR